MITMANLRVSGWGPFPTPGEKARLRKLQKKVNDLSLLASESGYQADDSVTEPGGDPEQERPAGSRPDAEPQTGSPAQLGQVGDRPDAAPGNSPEQTRTHHRDDAAEIRLISKLQEGASRQRIGERKIFFEDQEGEDVRELQAQLAKFGYLHRSQINGRFGRSTKEALRKFQHAFGIYVDGVAGNVTTKVMRFLDAIQYSPDEFPLSDDVRFLIQTVARSQPLGIVLIGTSTTVRQSAAEGISERLRIIDEVSRSLADRLDSHPIIQGAEAPAGYNSGRTARLADSINAELVLYLDVLDAVAAGPGFAAHFFSTESTNSAIGAPLAQLIHDELKRIPDMEDRGLHGDDSELLELPNAPTVQIELGNISFAEDRARLEDPEQVAALANAIKQGIFRLYDLELPGYENTPRIRRTPS
jgi:Putative peptidoglycan binding domain/N-acetylmuramoyl-L-alanine amidase